MHHIEFLLKHNRFFQRLYVMVFSFIFKLIGLFVKKDPHQVMFQSLIGRNYGDSPRVIFEAMKKDPAFKGFKYVWAFDDPEKFHVDGADKIKLTSMSYFMTALKSGVWVANVNIERGLMFKPQKTIFLNTGHGAQFKLDGNAQKNRNDYDYSDVDFFCAFSEFDRNIIVRDYKVHREAVVKCGIPRDDELYEVNQEKIDALREKFDIPEGKKVVLYAPTWRDSDDGGSSYTIAPPIEISEWRKMLGDEYILIFRMHHLSTKLLGITFDDFVRDGSQEQNVNDLLSIADVLITDYSSIAFDYAILERPIIAFAYDYEEYLRTRGLNEDLYTMFPGSVFTTQEEVINHILNMNPEEELKKSKRIRARYVEADGNATKVCMDYLKERLNLE